MPSKPKAPLPADPAAQLRADFLGIIERPDGTNHVIRRWPTGPFLSACGRRWPAPPEIVPLGSTHVGCRTCRAAVGRAMGWSAKLNERRCALIDRKYDRDDLSDAESAELDDLQERSARFAEVVAPMPFEALDGFERRLAEIREEVAKRGGRP